MGMRLWHSLRFPGAFPSTVLGGPSIPAAQRVSGRTPTSNTHLRKPASRQITFRIQSVDSSSGAFVDDELEQILVWIAGVYAHTPGSAVAPGAVKLDWTGLNGRIGALQRFAKFID